MLCCDASDADALFMTSPCAIIEVLSPATRGTDEREKLTAYRRVASLRYYVLVDSEAPAVTWHERIASSEWQAGILGRDEVLYLRCGNEVFPLSLGELYEGTGLLRG
jgi:Uma2 family endonuclease